MYGCRKSRTTPYDPQGNGACEWLNQTLISLLSTLDPEVQPQWHHRLPYLVQAYNNSVHSSTGMMPHFVVFGRHTRLPVDLVYEVLPPQQRITLEGWVHYHHQALVEAFERVKTHAAGMGPTSLRSESSSSASATWRTGSDKKLPAPCSREVGTRVGTEAACRAQPDPTWRSCVPGMTRRAGWSWPRPAP